VGRSGDKHPPGYYLACEDDEMHDANVSIDCRLESAAEHTPVPTTAFVSSTPQRPWRTAVGRGELAVLRAAGARRYSLETPRIFLFTMSATFVHYWPNRSTKCVAARSIHEWQTQWATWRASFWVRSSKVHRSNASHVLKQHLDLKRQ
jgi:hypothetical protein